MGQAQLVPNHTQIISRVYNIETTDEVEEKEWWPAVECDMTMLNIQDSRSLMYYVLHAKHAKKDDETITFMNTLGEDFNILKELAGIED